MVEAPSIPRRKAADDELSFDSLRGEAIKLLEQVSGQTWTDYNLHDPGITIVEQLVYALTDLIYRSGFEVQDYLASADGGIDFAAQNLIDPAEILSCRPATELDYRKLMLNDVPLADNVWLEAKTDQRSGGSGGKPDGSRYRGLYRLIVKTAQNLDQEAKDLVVAELQACFHASRNLCEDLDFDDIELIDPIERRLHAEIEVDSVRRPAELLAEIYFACERNIASSVSITNYDQLAGQTLALDRLFDGPLTRHGFFDDDITSDSGPVPPESALFDIVNSIDGVGRIRKLVLEPRLSPVWSEHSYVNPFDLFIPRKSGDVDIELTTNGRKLPHDMAEVNARFDQLKFKYYASRAMTQDFSMLYQPITGTSRDFGRYFSIQNQFPAIYGINRHGVPASAAADVKGKARQLKAYLLIFEQFMVNFLANIDALESLFSTKTGMNKSYALQTLSERQIDDLDAVYPQRADDVLGRIVARFDNHKKRYSRLLDYLLAMYGERFSQNSLRHFNFYYDRDEVDTVILGNKIAYLESIVELGRDRAAAPDYFNPRDGCSRCGLTRRASMLLGFERHRWDSLVRTIDRQKLELRPHADFVTRRECGDEYRLYDDRELGKDEFDSMEQAPLVLKTRKLAAAALCSRLTDIEPLRSNLLSDKLLSAGISIEHYQYYRIGESDSEGEFRLLLKLGDHQYWHLGDFTGRPAVIDAANSLRQLLLKLNRGSEGMHIVEHLLLRSCMRKTKGKTLPEDDFFSFRISVVLPAWTARCRNGEFRNLARETLRLNTPAHVFPEFCWLNYAEMTEFERLYDAWWGLKTQRQAVPARLDWATLKLAAFLRAHHEPRQQGG